MTDSRTFVISDTHFGHVNMYAAFLRADGTPVRPFANAAEGDAAMIERWNAVVRPQDKVFHCGDVTMNRRYIETVGLLHGRKHLLLGNHDVFNLADYAPYFYRISAHAVLSGLGLVLSHYPIHPSAMGLSKAGLQWRNVHGHQHEKDIPDGRYLNVSVEQTDYTPIPIEEVVSRLAAKAIQYPLP